LRHIKIYAVDQITDTAGGFIEYSYATQRMQTAAAAAAAMRVMTT